MRMRTVSGALACARSRAAAYQGLHGQQGGSTGGVGASKAGISDCSVILAVPLPPLQGFIPGWLVEALDHETLKRMIKAYMALPFSGV